VILDIRTYGDPVLRERGQLINAVDEEIRNLADDMLETMYDASGIGLAAHQIGRALMLCVVDVPHEADLDETGQPCNPDLAMPIVLINPEILDFSSRKTVYSEGCLSFPEINGNIERPDRITVRFRNLDFETVELTVCGLTSRAIQHEIDHLNGILYIDRMTNVKRVALGGKLKRLKKQTAQAMA
jgi:peptide deformylase